ncbi:MAG: hypothetical protein K9H16_00825, partial [Bacteroidales bacterium]|nr:hypothetical protein [Bacteroidales bacterium]
MKTKILFLLAAVAISVSAFSQRPTLEIHFTAKHQDQHVPLDSIFIKNLTQGGQTMLYYPDTTLVLDYVLGIANAAKQEQNKFTVLQNIPNPFSGKTNFDVIIPEKESVQIVVSDIVGKVTAFFSDELRQGKHTFCYKAGPQKFYLLTLSGKSGTKTIKMLNTGVRADHAGIGRIEYVGWNELPVMPISKSGKDFEYNLGDQLRFTGFATTMSGIAGNDIIVDNPISGETYEFNISEGIPCPYSPLVEYEGQVYHTILIGTQCWIKENMNVGTKLLAGQSQANNGIIEKYCYLNDESNCDLYGGLYQWDEMMQYSTQEGAKGICPQIGDWHIPTDDDWKTLEGRVDNQYHIGNSIWNITGWRGSDIGTRLKSTRGWDNGGNGTDNFGFTALAGGFYNLSNSFESMDSIANFWASSSYNTTNPWMRGLSEGKSTAFRHFFYAQDYGFSVRCVRFTAVNLPVVTTQPVSNISQYSATSGGTVTSAGNSPVIERGVCWSLMPNPTLENDHTADGSGSGTFESQLSDLFLNSHYYVRAYATNSEGTSYGEQVEFNTMPSPPCPGMETVVYGDKEYNTLMIGTLCWMKENLDIGDMIPGDEEQINNGVIEKYCYINDPAYCETYGGLYQWGEAMQYFTQPGATGICPGGWHIPTHEDWKMLEGTVDSLYPPDDPEWEEIGFRGYDVGKRLKSSYGWFQSNGND